MIFFLWRVDLLIDRSVDNCMACGGAHGECGEVARHLNNKRDKATHTYIAMQDVTSMSGDVGTLRYGEMVALS